MQSTKLSTLLNRMDRYQTIATIEEQYKVRDIDDALRNLLRDTQPPWVLKKSTLRIFDDVYEYPVAADHNYLAYLENGTLANNSFNSQNSLVSPARFFFTSLKEFYENPDYRNDIAEIWDNGTKYLGVRYEEFNFGSMTVDTSTEASHYTASGDASNIAVDNVFYKIGSSSIKFTVTNNTGVATVEMTPTSIGDSNYRKKYFFIYVYFVSAPTSVSLRFGNDSSNYLTRQVTTQFSGQAFKAGDWNLLGFDLNDATTVGAINSAAFDYAAVILNGASSGSYYINQSFLREWALMDYWYYSRYNVKTSSAAVADRDYFYDDDTTPTYSLDTVLIGDDEWADVVMYDAILLGMTDKENSTIISEVKERREKAFQKLMDTYPSEKPLITNRKYNFETDYNNISYRSSNF